MANNKVELSNGTVLMDITDTTAEASDVAQGKAFYTRSGVRAVGTLAEATDSTLGLIKTDSSKAITLNANGQLEVGGRLGKYPETTGIYAPDDREPRYVANYSMLVTDAKGIDMTANRSMAVVSGFGVTCKSAAAGTTEYHVANNYANRIICKLAENGHASRDEVTSTKEQIVKVLSVTIDGATFTPSSAPNDSTKDIIITTETTLNPSTTITNVRLFGKMNSYASLHVGNGIASGSSGRSLMLGGGITKYNGNDNCMIGQQLYASGNGNALFGRQHIAIKNRSLLAGTGHDTTNAKSESASAVGDWSYMDENTLFAVGKGTSQVARANAFEVVSDGIVLTSPNGTRYKITVDNNGIINTTSI